MSLRSSTRPTDIHTFEEDCGDQEVTTTALDFFLALQALDNRKIWRSATLLENGRRAGQGAFAFAEICELKSKRLVAVKRSLKLHGPLGVYQKQEFARHLKDFCRELCILTHDSLRSHDYIITLEGISEEDVSGVPSLSLVLEYGDCGTLDYFLQHNPTHNEELIFEFISQLTNGFEALHSLEICHGDVKTKNVLVVSNGSHWICKICDFGQAVLSSKIGDGRVRLPRGTAIYNAPEIRDLDESAASSFTIGDALLTDLYSFGLLVWEVLVQGEVYYKTMQTHGLATLTSPSLHQFLRTLPQNKLLQYASGAMDTQNFSKRFKDRFELVFQGTLQYHPKNRVRMKAINSLLGLNDANPLSLPCDPDVRRKPFRTSTTQLEKNLEHSQDTSGSTILSWSGELSLFQLVTVAECHTTLHKLYSSSLRKEIQEQMISELKMMAGNSKLPRSTRASAALSVSQCLTIGFDGVHDTDEIVKWLRHACILGFSYASHWFPRICGALCPGASILAQFRATDPELGQLNQSYLASSIRSNRCTGWRTEPLDTVQNQQLDLITHDTICDSSLFKEGINLLWNALEGNDGVLEFFRDKDSPESFEYASPQGFTPVHCACLGGHLSTLRYLLNKGYSANQRTIHGITPLHLCIFFTECNTEAAVHMLLESGPCPRETTSGIYLPEHDLMLSGSPLSWAILARNLQLVKVLLPVYTEDRPGVIRYALQNYYWEILDEILQNYPSEENLWDIPFFDFERHPYKHWIAHGSDRFLSIDRTVEVVQQHNLISIEESCYVTGNLIIMISSASIEEHFHHIERLLNIMKASQVKKFLEPGGSALLVAIARAKNNMMWKQTLNAILAHYSLEELQTMPFEEKEHNFEKVSFLHLSVDLDCVVGARALLERGVDPNLRGRGKRGITPLHVCLGRKSSVEMCDTLLEFGADVNIELLQSVVSPVTILTSGGRYENTRLIDHIIKTDHSEEAILAMLFNIIQHSPTRETQRYALLRYLLGKSNVAKHLNAQFAEGFTLLHFCVAYYLLEIIPLFLEAGADPLIGFRFEDRNVYPLQIACVLGRVSGDKSIQQHRPRSDHERTQNRQRSMDIALLLLKQQSTIKDNPFEGITQLHIASYMGGEQEIQHSLAEGKDLKAIGKWPQVPEGITPHRLIKAQLAYTKLYEIETEPNSYKRIWRHQLTTFDRNITSKATIATLGLYGREMMAARYLFQRVQKLTRRWRMKDMVSIPDGFG